MFDKDLSDEAINLLDTISESEDCEIAHIDADAVLCEILETLGYSELVDKYKRINKWYA